MSKIHKSLEDRVIDNVSLADIEYVGIDKILSIIQEALAEQGQTAKEMFVSLKRVPFICMHIEAIDEKLSVLADTIAKNKEEEDNDHNGFVTKDGMAAFTAVYLVEQATMKKIIYSCTGAIMLAILANLITRFAEF